MPEKFVAEQSMIVAEQSKLTMSSLYVYVLLGRRCQAKR
jgi:hypothetical protein